MTMEQICACALNKTFGYEPKISLGLVRELGSAQAVFNLSRKEMDEILGPFSKYRGKPDKETLDSAEKELAMLEQKGCRFLPFSSEDYPSLLKDCEDPPAGLYIRSNSEPAEIFGSRSGIAIVGTRDMSSYGREYCIRIVNVMSQAPEKPAIVSGLAFGVDITAHTAALDNGLPTIAVLPNGIDEVYPAAHRSAAARIAENPGSALITDYPPGTGPVAFTFLRRNRIIAGLSKATILIESKEHGGGLITARLASGYGREVFALPGRLDDSRSAGCNALIGEKLAEPIVNIEKAGEQLGLGRYDRRPRADLPALAEERYRDLPEEHRKALIATLRSIKERRGITLDELCRDLGLPYSSVAGLTGTLESDGFVDIDLMQRCTVNAKIS